MAGRARSSYRGASREAWRSDAYCQGRFRVAAQLGGCRAGVVVLDLPHPPAIGPEPEQRAQSGSDDECHRVPDTAVQASEILDNPDAPVVDEQADAVEEKEQDALLRRAVALAVPESPVPVTKKREDGGRDGRDGDRNVLAQALQGDRGRNGEQHADAADHEKLEALVNQQAEALVQQADADHEAPSVAKQVPGQARWTQL